MLRYLFPVPLCANSRYRLSVCLFLIITNVKHEHGDYVDFLYELFFVLVSHFFPLLTLVRATDVFQTCLLFQHLWSAGFTFCSPNSCVAKFESENNFVRKDFIKNRDGALKRATVFSHQCSRLNVWFHADIKS